MHNIFIICLILLTVSSCGTTTGYNDLAGGGIGGTGATNDYAGGGIGGTGISIGRIKSIDNTSVSVNGVSFETTMAAVTLDGTPGDISSLQPGMVVTVDGTFNDDGLTGVAVNVEFDDLLEGIVDYVDPLSNTLFVLGQTVSVSSLTIYNSVSDKNSDGMIDVSDIETGNIVEVSGFVDSNGVIQASYIALKKSSFDKGSEIELKGNVANLDSIPGTFQIGSLLIDYNIAGFKDMTIYDLKDGLYVEVKSTDGFSGGSLIASRIEREDHGYNFKDNDKFKVGGYVTALFTDGTFELSGQTVRVLSTTQYSDGSIVNVADIKVNDQLEVEGTVDSLGVLVADKIKIESNDSGSDDDSHHDSSASGDSSDNQHDDHKEGDDDPS